MIVISRMRSIAFALQGIKHMLIKEINARLHMLATILVVAAGVIHGLTLYRWIALVFAIALVWITEALNTAIEKLCDYACDNQYAPAIKTIKDVSAGAVLIAAICSAVIGLLVFIIK